jgi:triosephosphate isomerase
VDRRPIIAANWKMHKTHLEAIRDVQKLSYLLEKEDADRVEIVIAPAFTALRSIQTLIDSDRLGYLLGAQELGQVEALHPLLDQVREGFAIKGVLRFGGG